MRGRRERSAARPTKTAAWRSSFQPREAPVPPRARRGEERTAPWPSRAPGGLPGSGGPSLHREKVNRRAAVAPVIWRRSAVPPDDALGSERERALAEHVIVPGRFDLVQPILRLGPRVSLDQEVGRLARVPAPGEQAGVGKIVLGDHGALSVIGARDVFAGGCLEAIPGKIVILLAGRVENLNGEHVSAEKVDVDRVDRLIVLGRDADVFGPGDAVALVVCHHFPETDHDFAAVRNVGLVRPGSESNARRSVERDLPRGAIYRRGGGGRDSDCAGEESAVDSEFHTFFLPFDGVAIVRDATAFR